MQKHLLRCINGLGLTHPKQYRVRYVTPFLGVFDIKAKVQKKIYVENLLSRVSFSALINPCNINWLDYLLFFQIPGKPYAMMYTVTLANCPRTYLVM